VAFGDLVQAKRGTTSVTLTSAPTMGNLLVFSAYASSAVTFTAPTGFTAGTPVSTGGGSSRASQSFWKISAGTETGAISPATGTPTYCLIAEYAGAFAATPIDVENNQLVTTASSFDSPSVTPVSGVTRLLVASQGDENAGGATWGLSPQFNGSSVGVLSDLSTGVGDGMLFHKVEASTSGSYVATDDTASNSGNGESAIMIFTPGTIARKYILIPGR
jgi:hypothetical protein